MLFEVGDKGSELTAPASCASDRITAVPLEDFPARHLVKVLYAETPPLPLHHAKSRQAAKDNE